jgi:hypothetical protein
VLLLVLFVGINVVYVDYCVGFGVDVGTCTGVVVDKVMILYSGDGSYY